MKDSDLDNVLRFKKNDNLQIIEEVKEFASTQDVDSLEELNAKLSEFVNQKNSAGLDSFLGLSPTQMHLALYNQFSLSNHLFNFQCTRTLELKEVPIVKQAFFVLQKLNEAVEMKGTQLGNFPKSFVVEFYHLFLSNERYARIPNKEDDLIQLTRLKHLLDLSGLIKKRNKIFSLTKKGYEILVQDNSKQLFEEIILTWTNKFNWAFGDGYSGLEFIQKSATFNFYMLHRLCNEWIENKEMGKRYLDVFPDLIFEASDSYFGPEEKIFNCFSIRFLERFCLPLGLLEEKEEGDNYKNRKKFYRVTSIFKENFNFSF